MITATNIQFYDIKGYGKNWQKIWNLKMMKVYLGSLYFDHCEDFNNNRKDI